jgi:hypothetical protein
MIPAVGDRSRGMITISRATPASTIPATTATVCGPPVMAW